jgi:hypothetical protein
MQQLSLIGEVAEDFTSDDWETPSHIAQMIAAHVLPTDRLIIEPAAGTGQIAQYLPEGSKCIEIKIARYLTGINNAPKCEWLNISYLKLISRSYDLVAGNPPFSLAAEFINHSFLNILESTGRIVFLLPCDTFHKPTFLAKIEVPISVTAHPVVGRIAYLQNGKPVNGRQVYDSIFEIRRDG